MMHNYGEIHQSTHISNSSFIMRMVYPDFHNSLVTFRIDASDISFVVNIGKGRIVKAETRGFNKSTYSAGEVVVVMQNQGDLTQDFNLVLTKCFGREDLPSRIVTAQPGQSKVIIFPLLARNKGNINVHCESNPLSSMPCKKFMLLFFPLSIVQLFDKRFALLGSAKLTFSVDAPCFCFGICGCTVSSCNYCIASSCNYSIL